jgi:hypothetical protein
MSMRFRNFGGIHQFMVIDDEDLSKIDTLDPARWAATSAPIDDLQCDKAFLKYVDLEGSNRIRFSQIVAARDWTFERLSRRGAMKGRNEAIKIDDLASNESGDKLRAAAARVNREQKAADADHVSLSDLRAFKADYPKFLANGDGVIPPDVLPEADVAAFVRDIMATVGTVKDRGGADGISADHLDRFKTRGQAWIDWRAKTKDASPWGDDTASASALCAKLDAKIEEYFLHCDLMRHESVSEATLKMKEDDVRALRARDATALEAYLKSAPLATLHAKGALDLHGSINTLYRADFNELRDKVLHRVLGADVKELTRDTWRKARGTFDGFNDWQRSKPTEPFDALGEDKVKAYLTGPLPGRVVHFIELDKAAGPELAEIDNLEKLLLCVRWLVDVANNFVNFSAIYRPSDTALIEMGSLIIDSRRLEFCIRVKDRAAHKSIAAESLIFLVYAKIVGKDGGATEYEIVAPVTGGEVGRLRVGKRGIFHDNAGKEWDAEIVEIVENPISVKEAMVRPFRRAAKFVTDKIESWVASKAAAAEEGVGSAASAAATQAQTAAEGATTSVAAGGATAIAGAPVAAAPKAPTAAPPPAEGLNINSIVLGGGMALAGVGAVLGGLFGMLTSLSGWLAILGVIGAVMAFSGLLAWLKLRKRDLSVLLEANGWAVNVHTNITRRIAKVFAFTPDLPKEAKLDVDDMLPGSDDEGGSGFGLFLLVLLAGAATFSYLYFYKHMFH